MSCAFVCLCSMGHALRLFACCCNCIADLQKQSLHSQDAALWCGAATWKLLHTCLSSARRSGSLIVLMLMICSQPLTMSNAGQSAVNSPSGSQFALITGLSHTTIGGGC